MTSITLLRLSDAFSAIWSELAAECGVSLDMVASAEAAVTAPGTLGIVAAGGEEDDVARMLHRSTTIGVTVDGDGPATFDLTVAAAASVSVATPDSGPTVGNVLRWLLPRSGGRAADLFVSDNRRTCAINRGDGKGKTSGTTRRR